MSKLSPNTLVSATLVLPMVMFASDARYLDFPWLHTATISVSVFFYSLAYFGALVLLLAKDFEPVYESKRNKSASSVGTTTRMKVLIEIAPVIIVSLTEPWLGLYQVSFFVLSWWMAYLGWHRVTYRTR